MKFSIRAAAIAAVTFTTGALVALTTPGFAFEVQAAGQQVPVQQQNAQNAEQVPPPPAAADPLPEIGTDVADARNGENAEIARTNTGEGASSIEYASLTEAVDDQDISTRVDRELECLAIGVYYESKGEPLAGQLAVAQVILNRVESGRYPQTVCAVLTQRGQFSFVRGGRLPSPPNNPAWRRALAVAQVAQRDLWESPVGEALYFHANYVSPNWRRTRVASIGNHIFYR